VFQSGRWRTYVRPIVIADAPTPAKGACLRPWKVATAINLAFRIGNQNRAVSGIAGDQVDVGQPPEIGGERAAEQVASRAKRAEMIRIRGKGCARALERRSKDRRTQSSPAIAPGLGY
jgi:hypothetical protein